MLPVVTLRSKPLNSLTPLTCPEGIILLDVLHKVNHNTPQQLNITMLDAKNVLCSIGKNMLIASKPCGELQQGP